MELRHRCRVAEAELCRYCLVAMVSKTACDGFRVGKVVESNRYLEEIKRVTRRKEELEGKNRVAVETKMSKREM